jgi:hypothetical protein
MGQHLFGKIYPDGEKEQEVFSLKFSERFTVQGSGSPSFALQATAGRKFTVEKTEDGGQMADDG